MAKGINAPSSRQADARRFAIAGASVALALSGLLVPLSSAVLKPYSTTVDFVEDPADWAVADPAELDRDPAVPGPVVRIGFVGDIMQHRRQAGGDFQASYARIRPMIEAFDLAVGNLEFPVDPSQPVGPPVRSVRFNGSPEHLDALAEAGFDVLSTANNHTFDQGLEGVRATLDALAARGLIAVGTGETGTADALRVVEAGGLRIGFAAYTIPPNSYNGADGETDYWRRDWPVHELNFDDWSGEYRSEGLAKFRAHVSRSVAEETDLLIALVHWGDEWHFQPNADQQLAARDMIDAGFDLVIGGHSHVLNPPELYRGSLIAYSLGNLVSDFVELENRTGAVLEVAVGVMPDGSARIVDFALFPVLTSRQGHVVTPLGDKRTGEEAKAWDLARRIFGPAVTLFGERAEPISARLGASAGREAGSGRVAAR